jgi:hypothetical protein
MKILDRFINAYKNLESLFAKVPKNINRDIPYHSQFESRELVHHFISEKITALEDPKWQNSGADSKEEYEFWAWRSCGMTCLKMILEQEGKGTHPIVNLAKECEKFGGYDRERDHLGLIYDPFCTFVKQKFNLNASVVRKLNVRRIKYELAQGNHIIVSVHPDIRDKNNPEPKRKGGHLVLLTGYEQDTVSIHNPSGTHTISQEHYTLQDKEFLKFFAKRGIIISR